MSKYVAYEWDEHELRVVGGSPRGEGLVVDNMQIIPLHGEGEEPSKDDVPATLAAALTKAGFNRTDAIAVISRNRVELKQMSLPLAPPDEFPTLVRFQAMREFAKLSEDWPLDYLPLSKPPVAEGHESHEETIPILASAIPPEMLTAIKATSHEAGLDLLHVVLRPCSSASLFLRRPESAEHGLVLLIDIEANEADITVLHGRDPVLLRTARLSQDVLQADGSAGSLLGEVRRTLPAAHNIVRGERVSAIFLSGATEGHKRLAETIQTTLEIPCTAFDPFSQVEVARKAQPQTSNPAVFVGLVGALLDEVQGAPHSFDFLHPRRPPAPPSQKRRMALIGGIAAAVILIPLAIYWYKVTGYSSQVAEIKEKTEKLEKETEEHRDVKILHSSLMAWEDSNIDWLEELSELSSELGPADAKISSLYFANSDNGGKITITGQASLNVVRQGQAESRNQQLYQKLSDNWHAVTPGPLSETGANPDFPFEFDLTIDVQKSPPPQPVANEKQADDKQTQVSKADTKTTDPEESPVP